MEMVRICSEKCLEDRGKQRKLTKDLLDGKPIDPVYMMKITLPKEEVEQFSFTKKPLNKTEAIQSKGLNNTVSF